MQDKLVQAACMLLDHGPEGDFTPEVLHRVIQTLIKTWRTSRCQAALFGPLITGLIMVTISVATQCDSKREERQFPGEGAEVGC